MRARIVVKSSAARGSGAFAAQLLDACPDHYKIVGNAGSAHISSVSLVGVGCVDRAVDDLLRASATSATVPIAGLQENKS
jgi:hypothetical protein